MNTALVVLQGVVKPDGTLELAETLKLPPGPVRITIQPLAQGSDADNWWAHLQRIRADMEARGYPFFTEEEGQAYIEELRSGDERIEEIYRQSEESRKS